MTVPHSPSLLNNSSVHRHWQLNLQEKKGNKTDLRAVSEWRSVTALLLQGVNGNVHTQGEQSVLSAPSARSESNVVCET